MTLKHAMQWLTLPIVLSILALVWFWPHTNDPQTSSIGQTAHQPASTDGKTAAVLSALDPATSHHPHRFVTGLEQLPHSLDGTEVDGEIIIDDQRNLVVTRRLRDLFDYFLSAIGEEDLATISQRVDSYIRHRVPEPAQSQAIRLFHQYLGYRDAVGQIQEAGGKALDQINPDDIEKQKTAEQQVRRRFFNANEIQAFFGDSDAFDQYQLRVLRIQQNNGLSEVEKARQLAELNAQLPQTMQDDMKTALQYQQLQSMTEAMNSRQASAAELHNMRTNLVGADATARLEALDQTRAAFEQRVNAYLAQRQQVLSQTNLNDTQQQQQIAALRQQGFTAQEQLRLPAFEQMAALSHH
jgi:lipase chaperone LimK